jgi:hypothetical protein
MRNYALLVWSHAAKVVVPRTSGWLAVSPPSRNARPTLPGNSTGTVTKGRPAASRAVAASSWNWVARTIV